MSLLDEYISGVLDGGITSVVNPKDDVYNQIKSKNLDVVIYGAGEVALQVCKLLRKHGIYPLAFAVDSPYYRVGRIFDGLPVLNFSIIKKCASKCVFVLGIGEGESVKKFLEDEHLIKYTLAGTYGEMAEIDLNFLISNAKGLQETYSWLEDDLSRKTMLSYLALKVSGSIKCNVDVFFQGNYFDSKLIPPLKNSVFIDCGAFCGDTIEAFINWTNGDYKRVYAIEMDKQAIRGLNLNIQANDWKNVVVIEKAACNSTETLSFASKMSGGSSLRDDSGEKVNGCTIDEILNGFRVDLIKMDIEGAELEALKGASISIRKYRPYLIICVYHLNNDLIAIPKFINKMGNYKLYLRKHHISDEYDLILYAIPYV